MKSPCEIVVWYILPQIRAELARELVRQGLSQKETAEKLRLTPAAVSQYISKKRGKNMKFPDELNGRISKLALTIRDRDLTDREILKSICTLCEKIRKTESFKSIQKSYCRFCL